MHGMRRSLDKRPYRGQMDDMESAARQHSESEQAVNAKERGYQVREMRRLLAIYRNKRMSVALASARGSDPTVDVKQTISWAAICIVEILDRLEGKAP